MIAFAERPIPVMTPLGGGYVVYVESSTLWENDVITVALLDGGQWRHFRSNDIQSWHNETFGIQKQNQ